jgi:hypothetical protein
MSASASFLPYAIQCAELAARRESTRVRQHLQRRVTSLASIASTAAFIGFLGTAWGLMNSFGPVDGSRSSILGQIADGISQSMVPGLLGLFVAVLASWSYQYLRGRMEAFNLEMESTTVDFVNRLIVHLDGLKSTDPPLWAVLSRRAQTCRIRNVLSNCPQRKRSTPYSRARPSWPAAANLARVYVRSRQNAGSGSSVMALFGLWHLRLFCLLDAASIT